MAGVAPLTSPPIYFRDFDAHVLEGHDLIFFKLHGLAGQPYWYGDGGLTAISAEQLAGLNLKGALVFAENCWGGRESPMVQALLKAGAACVVTGTGVNIGESADVIAATWRGLVRLGVETQAALGAAKVAAFLIWPRLLKDIQSFVIVGDPKAKLKDKRKENRR